MPTSPKSPGGISSEAVQAKTGRTWPEWFAALDAAGCQAMSHKDIVAILREKFGVGPWWQQMVTVGYEQARGLRDRNQNAQGYAVSASRTIAVPVETLFEAWQNPRQRKRWLPDPITVRTATANRSMRITWGDGPSSVSVGFTARGAGKSQVALQHEKLPAARDVARQRRFWRERLDGLQALLEAGPARRTK